MSACPVCADMSAIPTVRRAMLPAMQNYVYRERDRAVAARCGELELAACRSCGFAWNQTFDPSRLEYDSGYDNAVPSAVMAQYYEEIATYLGEKYDLSRGYVVDIGCGNGTFLKAFAKVWPECRGLGVDPALERDEVVGDGRVRLVKGVFDDRLLAQSPSLFLCRHVLEHIPAPIAFVNELRRAVGGRSVPLFVEVPDVGWIVDHDAFWDFCYEHCNYFSEPSLSGALTRAGFRPTATRVAYGRQYRWMEAVADDTAASVASTPSSMAARLQAYGASEQALIERARRRLAELKAAGYALAIWGMATKGVVFSLLVDADSALLDAAVDVNVNKQGCFAPLTGRPIDAPSALQRFEGRPLAVIVMNTNYLAEITNLCRELGLTPTFLSASGDEA